MMESIGDSFDLQNYVREDSHIRRPPNAFMIFGQKFRKVFKQNFNELNNKEISKLLGDEWRKMDANTKSQYHTMADEAHRQHLLRHPGYYYSPLEARQRKAERKRKPKMSAKFDPKTETNRQFDGPFAPTLYGNRPFLFRNPMYPMVRPMFCRPMHSPMSFPQQFCRFRPNYSMGGLIPLGPYAMPPMFHTAGEPIKREYFEVNEESNQSIQGIENSDMESQIQCYRQEINRTQSADIGLLSSLLPPMHNPSTEVTQVFQTEDQLIGQNSGMTSEVTKMVNAVVEQQLVLPQFQEEGDEQLLIDIQSEVEVISQPNDIQEVK